MIEDGNDIPIGIAMSMSLYATYTYIIDKLLQMPKIDNWIMFAIYFVPFIALYIEIPIILKKSNGWKKYTD